MNYNSFYSSGGHSTFSKSVSGLFNELRTSEAHSGDVGVFFGGYYGGFGINGDLAGRIPSDNDCFLSQGVPSPVSPFTIYPSGSIAALANSSRRSNLVRDKSPQSANASSDDAANTIPFNSNYHAHLNASIGSDPASDPSSSSSSSSSQSNSLSMEARGEGRVLLPLIREEASGGEMGRATSDQTRHGKHINSAVKQIAKPSSALAPFAPIDGAIDVSENLDAVADDTHVPSLLDPLSPSLLFPLHPAIPPTFPGHHRHPCSGRKHNNNNDNINNNNNNNNNNDNNNINNCKNNNTGPSQYGGAINSPLGTTPYRRRFSSWFGLRDAEENLPRQGRSLTSFKSESRSQSPCRPLVHVPYSGNAVLDRLLLSILSSFCVRENKKLDPRARNSPGSKMISQSHQSPVHTSGLPAFASTADVAAVLAAQDDASARGQALYVSEMHLDEKACIAISAVLQVVHTDIHSVSLTKSGLTDQGTVKWLLLGLYPRSD